jgi:hypothetical protein
VQRLQLAGLLSAPAGTRRRLAEKTVSFLQAGGEGGKAIRNAVMQREGPGFSTTSVIIGISKYSNVSYLTLFR